VVDETPIGNFGEIEGPARWIDRTAQALRNLRGRTYITQTYAELVFCLETAHQKSGERDDFFWRCGLRTITSNDT